MRFPTFWRTFFLAFANGKDSKVRSDQRLMADARVSAEVSGVLSQLEK